MSQHQARVPVKCLKLTALTWKVKDKAASQLVRSDAISGVNREDRERLSSTKFWLRAQQCLLLSKFKLRRDSAGSCFMRSHKGRITFYNFEAVSVKFQFHLYMTSVGSRGPSLPYKSLIKEPVPFHFKTMIHAHYSPRSTYTGLGRRSNGGRKADKGAAVRWWLDDGSRQRGRLLQRMMFRLNKTTTEYGMKISTNNTKVMKISRVEEEEKNIKITIDG